MQKIENNSYNITRQNWDVFLKKAKKIDKKGNVDKAEEMYKLLLDIKKDKKLRKRLDRILKEKNNNIKKTQISVLLKKYEINGDNGVLNSIIKIIEDVDIFHLNIQEFTLDSERIQIIIKICNILYLKNYRETFKRMWEYREVQRLISLNIELESYKGYCLGHELIKEGKLWMAYKEWSKIDYKLFSDDYYKLQNLLKNKIENKISKILLCNDLPAFKETIQQFLELFTWKEYILQMAKVLSILWKEERIKDILFCFSSKDFLFWESLTKNELLIKSYFSDSEIVLNIEYIFNIWSRASSYQLFNDNYESTPIEKRDFAIIIPYLVESSFFIGNPQKVQILAHELLEERLDKCEFNEEENLLYTYSKEKAKTARIFDIKQKGNKKWFLLSLLSQFISNNNDGQRFVCSEVLSMIDTSILKDKKNKYLSDLFWPLDYGLLSLRKEFELAKKIFNDGKGILKNSSLMYNINNTLIESIIYAGEESFLIGSIFDVLINKEAKGKDNFIKLFKKLLKRFDNYELWQKSFIDFIENNRNIVVENLKKEFGYYLLLYCKQMELVAPKRISERYKVQSFFFSIDGIDYLIKNICRIKSFKKFNFGILWTQIEDIKQSYTFANSKKILKERCYKTSMLLAETQIKFLIQDRKFFEIRKFFDDSKLRDISYEELKTIFFKELESFMYYLIGPGNDASFNFGWDEKINLKSCLDLCLELDPMRTQFITREIENYSNDG